MTRVIIKIFKSIQIVNIINYVSIHLSYIIFIKLYLTNFWNKKVLNNLSHSVAILVKETMGEIDESKVGAKTK